ncbi:MAG: hypothetical protein KDC87_10440 [Planctomycetes bacterium]|nr:hypothetical protein [Planctomycetota bacterium]
MSARFELLLCAALLCSARVTANDAQRPGAALLDRRAAPAIPSQDGKALEWRPAMGFELAHKRFLAHPHRSCGYVDRNGRLRNRGLAPAAYVSVVLHRMRFGNAWLRHYNIEVHQWRGDRIARYFGLTGPRVVDAGCLLDPQRTAAFVHQGVLHAQGLYLFHAAAGGRSHVGFIMVGADGSLVQSHYSGLARYGHHVGGDFRAWLRASPFRDQPVQLFAIPSPSGGSRR